LSQAADKDAELLALLERTPIELWNEDLDAFLKEWEVNQFFFFFRRKSDDIERSMLEILSRL